jgi:hypothetical protein
MSGLPHRSDNDPYSAFRSDCERALGWLAVDDGGARGGDAPRGERFIRRVSSIVRHFLADNEQERDWNVRVA